MGSGEGRGREEHTVPSTDCEEDQEIDGGPELRVIQNEDRNQQGDERI